MRIREPGVDSFLFIGAISKLLLKITRMSGEDLILILNHTSDKIFKQDTKFPNAREIPPFETSL